MFGGPVCHQCHGAVILVTRWVVEEVKYSYTQESIHEHTHEQL